MITAILATIPRGINEQKTWWPCWMMQQLKLTGNFLLTVIQHGRHVLFGMVATKNSETTIFMITKMASKGVKLFMLEF